MKLPTIKLTNKNLVIGFILLTTLVFIYENATKEGETKDLPTLDSVDTLIPNGMTLVPIEILNSSALSELIGSHGVVDLYMPPQDGRGKPRKVVSAVKIMRAPLNPNVYAVLVRDSEAPEIARNTNGYFVTVQNPKSQKFSLEKQKLKKPTYITSEM